MLAPGANLELVSLRQEEGEEPESLGAPAESPGLGPPEQPMFVSPTAVSKRKSVAFPGRQPSPKVSKVELDDSVSTPPCNPPGEAFAVRFLREYVAGSLLTPRVIGLASIPGRKWGLACELPGGWYVIDDTPGPAQILPHFDSSSSPPCGWKVTGPQMKVFNPDVPVQIRYGNPKDGCTKQYSAMRAAVYTWCREDAEGATVESSVKLIHVYVGRASRNRNAPRRSAGRRAAVTTTVAPAVPTSTPPDAGFARQVGQVGHAVASAQTQTAEKLLTEQLAQLTGDMQRNLLKTVRHRLVTQLIAQKMEDAARVVDRAMADMQTDAHLAGQSQSCCRQQNLKAAIEEERKEEAYALEIGAQLRSRAEVIAMINKEYVRLYSTGPPHYTEDAIAWLLKELQSKCKQTARRMARIVIAYEKKHIEDHDITVKSHNMAAKVLHMLGTGVHMYDEEEEHEETQQLPRTAAPRVISQEEKAVAQGIGSAPRTNQQGKRGETKATRENKTETETGGTDGSAASKASPTSKSTGEKGSEDGTGGDDDDDDELQVAAPAAVVPTTPSATTDAGVASSTAAASDTTADTSDARVALEIGAPRNDLLGARLGLEERAPPFSEMSDASIKIDTVDSVETLSTNLPDIEELMPGPTCFASLSTIQAGRDQLCELEECDQAWKSSGVICPTKRLPERSAHPSRYELERRECPTQLGTLNHIYTQTMECPPRLPTDEEEIKTRYEALNKYDRQFPGCEQRQSQLTTQSRSDSLLNN